MARLFVAAWPDDAVTGRLAAVRRPDEDGVRWVPPAHWHITLRFLGEAPIDDVVARLAHERLPTATVSLGPVVERLGPQAIVVPVEGAGLLAAAVAAATDGLGEPDRFDFRGHLTIARTRRDAPSSVVGTAFEATMHIDRIALVRSHLGSNGSAYETIATFDTV